MILLFSGTGNTRYAAEMLSRETGDSIIKINETKAEGLKLTGDRLVLMFPIYAWGPAPLMVEYFRKLPRQMIDDIVRRDIPVSIVCTCGDEAGNGVEVMRSEIEKRGLTLAGAWTIIMPNVYILLPGFNVDSTELAERKLDSAVGRVRRIGRSMLEGDYAFDVMRGSHPGLKTSLVYPLFKKYGINYRRWHWTKECIGCGKCATVCPVRNISMKGGHPDWGANCLSCLACYGICPTHAVAYGKITEHKGQYFCHRSVTLTPPAQESSQD